MTQQDYSTDSRPQKIKAQRVLIVTGDPLGEKLAGPAIRAINFAIQLSADSHVVRVASLQQVAFAHELFESIHVETQRDMTLLESWADIIIVQGNALVVYPSLAQTKKYLVVDIYDPMHLEQLEQGRGLKETDWNQAVLGANAVLNHQLRIGDFFLAASERQLHFWLGALASQGRINTRTYLQDVTLNSLIDIVPFGLDGTLPKDRKPALRQVIPGIDENSKLLIWAGGLYNWFDPETLVKAVGIVASNHPEVRLFFMGTQHPHSGVPEMDVIRRTRELSASLGLTNKHVFFNDSWVDYSDRHNYLLEADAGVTTHFEHIETTFSFRTRILDYLWAGIPIISTKGDTFAQLVDSHRLGVTVVEQDEISLSKAIESVLFDSHANEKMRSAVADAREQFTWQKVTGPLRAYCASPYYAADRLDFTATGTIRRPVNPGRSGLTLRRVRRAWGILISDGPGALVRAARRPHR